ncbi:MAG: UDP-N-acetylmuramoyl-tripeptide--D-alanyl-D-alanine ligase [Flavobacteriaceae bacterium]
MTAAELHSLFLKSSGVSTDTRTLKKGNLFFCLTGEHFNGNEFAQKALTKGAAFVIMDDRSFYTAGNKEILTENSLELLQELAQYHRKQFNIPVIGLTGSNGKTTTKELISSVLSQKYSVQATLGNLNNHIGVPLTLLQIDATTDIALIEMGANHEKEIAFLCEIARPTLGYITNFGKAHLEGFKSLEGVVRGKSELYDYLRKNKGKAFVNSNDPMQVKQSQDIDRVFFGKGDLTQIWTDNTLDHRGYCKIISKNKTYVSQITGAYNFDNLNAAYTIGVYFDLTTNQIESGIGLYKPNNNRSEWRKTKKNTLLLDAYNANPSSMIAALKAFDSMKVNAKVVILGDMLELGAHSQNEHQSIVDLSLSLTFDLIILIGPHFGQCHRQAPIQYFESTLAAKVYLKEKPIEKATLLIKGSRGIALENLLEVL